VDDLHEHATNVIGVVCGFPTSPERRQMRELLVVPPCVETENVMKDVIAAGEHSHVRDDPNVNVPDLGPLRECDHGCGKR